MRCTGLTTIGMSQGSSCNGSCPALVLLKPKLTQTYEDKNNTYAATGHLMGRYVIILLVGTTAVEKKKKRNGFRISAPNKKFQQASLAEKILED